MIVFLAVMPVLSPFLLIFLRGRGLPEKLVWWKSYAAGFWSYLVYLLVSWIIRIPSGMVPSFLSDYLFWASELFSSLAVAALLGMLLFRSGFFSGFLQDYTVYAFFSGLFLPMGLDAIIRYPDLKDPFVLFFLPVTELGFVLILTLLFIYFLRTESSRKFVFILLALPAAFIFALIPALFYSFYWIGAGALFASFAAAVSWLIIKEDVVT